MKQLCLKALMLLAMAWAIPIANAAKDDYKLTVNTTPIWTVGSDLVPSVTTKSVAVDRQNEKLYMFNGTKLYETNGDEKSTQTVDAPSGVTYANANGYGVTHDDEGNVIVVPNAAVASRTITHLTVFKGTNIGSQKKVIDIPDVTLIAVFHISATGDIFAGNGEVWFAVPGESIIRRLTLTNGTGSWTNFNLKLNDATLTLTTGSPYPEKFIQKLSDGTLFLHDRGSGGHFYRVRLSGTTANCTEIELPSDLPTKYSPKSNMGATMYIWKDRELLFCHSNSTVNYTSTFSVVDLATGDILARDLDPLGAASTVDGYGIWVHAVPDKDDASGNTLDVYAYKAANGAAKYSITATDAKAPVISRTATVQNDANSFYVYAYATDNIGVTSVKFPTWTDLNGQDDLANPWPEGTAGSWTVGGQTYNYRYLVNKSDHKNENGPYCIHVYAYDAAGNSITSICENFTFTKNAVKNLSQTVTYNSDGTQKATLTWEAPETTETVTGYKVSYSTDGGSTYTELGTTTALTYVHSPITVSTTYKVVPVYEDGDDGDASTIVATPYTFNFTAPTDVVAEEYEGFARVVVSYNGKPSEDGSYAIKYNIYRDGALIAEDLTQLEYIDTNVSEGEHSYKVEAEYFIKDSNEEYTIEIANLAAEPVSVRVNKKNTTLVNYTLETVYNVDMWEFYEKADPVNSDLPANFDPNQETQLSSTKTPLYVDAENYRQGALFTDKDGKKWWLIMQRTKSAYANYDDIYENVDATNAANNCGILMLPAEESHYSLNEVVNITDADVKMLDLPITDQNGNDITIKSGQSVGIAIDDAGNILIRGYHKLNELKTAINANWASAFMKAIVYRYDSTTGTYTKGYTVDLSHIDFGLAGLTPGGDNGYKNVNARRTDYYRLSGNIFGTGGAKLYCSASNSSGTDVISIVSLTGSDTAVTATVDTQKSLGTTVGAENYVFPVAMHPTNLIDEGEIFQIRSNAYFKISADGNTSNAVLTGQGKTANSGGTTVRMVGKTGATQLFLITPQSIYSKNIGGFSVGMVYENNFSSPIVPVANMVQEDTHGITTHENSGGNVNGNWLFAEHDSIDQCIYIYQYVPGIRIAKYKLSGGIKFFGSHPTLKIVTTKCADGSEISHFTATTTWSTPDDYAGKGNYDISYYKVELLDNTGKVIATKNVDARTEGTVYQTVTRTDYTYELKNYTLTFEDLDDIDDKTVETGNGDGHIIDDNCTYTVQITTMFDLTMHLDDPVTNPSSDEQASIMAYHEATHEYTANQPKGTVTIYEGTGTVDNVYRVEIDIQNNETDGVPVSHYELSYLADKNNDGVDEEYRIDNFILVTSEGQTDGQKEVPGTNVRKGDNGYLSLDGVSRSPKESYVAFYVDNRGQKWEASTQSMLWTYPQEESWQIPSNWEYKLTAVYADDNSLLRKTPYSTMSVESGGTTGEEMLEIDNSTALKAFPIPAESTLTVQSPQGIEMIRIISSSGVEVKRADGDGSGKMTIGVEDLPSGYYMLRVNNLAPIKIVKK